MKLLIFGNLASGKSYLSGKILTEITSFEYLAIDDFRRRIGDGTMEKEQEAKQTFLDSIQPNKLQLIEATGLGDTGEMIASLLRDTDELKFIFILKTPLEICLERLKSRTWDVPYPAPPTQAFKLAETTDEIINRNTIQDIWLNAINCKIIEINDVTDNDIRSIIKILK